MHFVVYLQLGGMNSFLSVEYSPSIPMVSKVPTIIIGMDVSHGSPGRSDVPSVAAVNLFARQENYCLLTCQNTN